MKQHGSKYLPIAPPDPGRGVISHFFFRTPWGGVKRSEFNFFMVMLHMNRITDTATRQQTFCPHTPHPEHGVKSKNSSCIKKLKGVTNAATWYQIFCLQTTIPQGGVKMSKFNKSNRSKHFHGHVAYKENR